MVHLALLYHHLAAQSSYIQQRYDNSCRLVSPLVSQQESATCEDILHFNFLPSFSQKLAVQLSLVPGHFGGEERTSAVPDNSPSSLTDGHKPPGSSVSQDYALISSSP